MVALTQSQTLWTTRDVCSLLGISRAQLSHYRQRDGIDPSHAVGNVLLWTPRDVDGVSAAVAATRPRRLPGDEEGSGDNGRA